MLARLLNAHPEVISLGDTYPSNGFDQTCGCGRRVSECEFWISVKRRVKASRYAHEPAMLPRYPRLVSNGIDRYLYALMPLGAIRRLSEEMRGQLFASDYEAFLHAVHNCVGKDHARVFVDGVKSVARVKAMLATDVAVDGIIHLMRSPGDFAKSCSRQSGDGYVRLARAGLAWRLYHANARRLRHSLPYLPITYERLVERPEDVLPEIFRFIEVPARRLSELVPHFQETWHFMGNISQMAFDGVLHRSRHSLSVLEKAVVRLAAGAEPETRVRRRESATC